MNTKHSHLAQLNIARMRFPLDDPRMADFVTGLERINALADAAPGFVWRLQSESGNATDIQAFDDPRLLVNMSVWESLDALRAYVYRSQHADFLRRRKEWFASMETPMQVLWWIPAGHVPTVAQAKERLEHLTHHGVTVIGYRTDDFPAFYSQSSGLPVDVRCDSPAEVAAIWRAKRSMGLPGGLLMTVPVPWEDEIPAADIEPVIEQAVAEAAERGLHSAEVTPFLLTRIAELTGERSLRANLALLKNNAWVAAEIAVELRKTTPE